MHKKYKSLIYNTICKLTLLPPIHLVIWCKKVLRIKRDAIGHIVKYKTRLVAKVYLGVVRLDFNKTFAQVAIFTTKRTMVEIGGAMDLEMHQRNVKIAFLNKKLEDNIYMEQC